VAFGALPYDRRAPSQLVVHAVTLMQNNQGEAWCTSVDGVALSEVLVMEPSVDQSAQSASALKYVPSGEEFARSVAHAVEELRRGDLVKVVLARAVEGHTDHPIDPGSVAQHFRQREVRCTVYGLALGDGRRFVGASPELLVGRRSGDATCHPLAGTIALPPNVDPESYQSWLLGSGKNLYEHRVLVTEVVEQLTTRYHEVHADPQPTIVTLRSVAHLGTWIRAHHDSVGEAPDALDLVALLHPTAAVGGIPRDTALALQSRLEPEPRGFYAGPVGWCDQQGDGDWWIGIRGVELMGAQFRAMAGAGIVSESDPVAEREETRDKLASVMSSVLIDRI
jgi:isochorismate synthase